MADRHAATSQRDVAWLVLRAQAGDRQAVEDLLRLAEGVLRPYVTAMIGDRDHAADVLQESLILVYRRLGTLREPRAFHGWARRVASREIFRWHTGRRRTESYIDDVPEIPDESSDEPEADDLRARLPELLSRVSPASRAVIVLHYMQGLSIEETAAVLDVSTGTAKSRLAYGLKSLRRLLSHGCADLR